MPLYPLIFHPRFVPKIWGGRKLATLLQKPLPPDQSVGESWELFDFPPGVVDPADRWISATVANGPLAGQTLHDLMLTRRDELLGDVPALPSGQFPLLVKFLDAREDLSVQVHPPRTYADAHPGAHLKTEAWYILQHDPGARLLKGLRPGVTPDAFRAAIADGTVETLIAAVPAKPGDCHFLPSGTVHALGAGILVAEVQTPSDTTFRVFDFNRLENGQPRQLHVEQALACIDFDHPSPPAQPRSHVASHFTTVTKLVDCPFFTLEKVRMTEGLDEPLPYDHPVVWMFLSGSAQLRVKNLPDPVSLLPGQTLLLPADMDAPRLQTLADSQWLEVTLPSRPPSSAA